MISNFILDHRSVFIQLWKTGVIVLSLWSAYMLRFDFDIPATEMRHVRSGIVIALMAKMLVFYLLGLDRGLWRFTGATDVPRIFVANLSGSILFTIATAVVVGRTFPRAV
jgi:FlaA1/EpsC-like NDP-sugar epimerase